MLALRKFQKITRTFALVAVGLSSCLLSATAAAPKVDPRLARFADGHLSAPTEKGTAVLTIDPDLQRDVSTLISQSRAQEAAVVVIDIHSGKILAWSSLSPSGRDLVARPYAPPASLFKVITASALIDRANVPLRTKQCYVGGERNVRLSDLRRNGAGDGVRCSDLHTALGYSRNLVIAGLALRYLKAPTVEFYAKALGFTDNIPIDVAMEPGSVEIGTDDEAFAKSAAGFSPGRISPLSAAYMMSIIARGGDRIGLSLIDHVVSPQGQNLPAPPAFGDTGRVLRPSTASYLTRMLEVTVREGTCAAAFKDPQGEHYLGNIRVAGKTGTLFRAHPKRLYSWFAGFAPANKPQIAIAVMLANDTNWWRKANEVGRDVLRSYFARKGSRGVEHPFALRSKRSPAR